MTALLRDLFRALLLRLKAQFLEDDSKKLVEYALIVAVLGFCALASMHTIVHEISNACTTVATTFNADL